MPRRSPTETANGAYVSTGRLPSPERVRALVTDAYERFKSNTDGENSKVYPALARVPSDLFGICVVGTSGNVYAAGAAEYEFTIMSVSKPFLFALVCEAVGVQAVREKVGVNATGLAFNSLEGIERTPDGRTNPMVNSGAIATTSCLDSPAAHCRSTMRCTPLLPRPTIATRASLACSRAMAASTWTRLRRSTCTPSSVR